MTLPIKALPTDSVEVNGEIVEFRSLSRTEALKVTTQFYGKADAAEVFLLQCGVSCTEDEATAWLGATTHTEAGKLIDGIIFLSGLSRRGGAGKEAPDPKSPSSEP